MVATPKRNAKAAAKSVTISSTSEVSTPASTRASRSRNSPAEIDFGASTYGRRVFPAKPAKAMPTHEEREDESESESESESDAETTAQVDGSATGVPCLKKHLTQATGLLSKLERVASQKCVSVQARKLLGVLTDAVQVFENFVHDQASSAVSSTSSASTTSSASASVPIDGAVPPGWSMYDFLMAEGKKHVKHLNKTHFATKDDRSVTMEFNGTKEDSRYVCIACFEGGYLPESCVLKNLLGFMLHRKKGTGEKQVVDPCLKPADVLEYKETEMVNGGKTCQAVIDLTVTPLTCVRIIVPVNNELDEYCNIFFEATVIHTEAVVQKYKDELQKYNNETRGMSKAEKAAVKKVKKPASSKWRMVGLTPTIQNMVDFNIYQFIRDRIASKRAFERAHQTPAPVQAV